MNWIFLFLSLNVVSSIADMRSVYLTQDEAKITKMYKLLKARQQLSPDEECYLAAFECLQAKYSINPYTKYNYFSSGYNRLNGLINRYSVNPEYRYHRLMIEKNAPAFLIEKNHIVQDKSIIKKYNNIGQPLFREMAKAAE
jgi:hypothetical protein